MYRPLTPALTLTLALTLPSLAADVRLVVRGALDREIVAEFEKANACRVDFVTGADQQADVIIASDRETAALRQANRLTEISAAQIPNLTNLDARFTSRPESPYAAPLAWGTYGILARRPDGKNPVDPTWALVFDPARAPGKLSLLDDDRVMIAAALLFSGAPANSTEAKDLVKTRSMLLSASARAAALDTSGANAKGVQKGDFAAAVVSSRDTTRSEKVDFAIPREGSLMWIDYAAIPTDAPHPQLAAQLVNHLLSPEPGALFASHVHGATPNLAARRLVSMGNLGDGRIYPPLAVMQTLKFIEEIPEDHRMLYDQIWQQTSSRFGKSVATEAPPDTAPVPLAP
jgi:spermidine/putrescine-binding protein